MKKTCPADPPSVSGRSRAVPCRSALTLMVALTFGAGLWSPLATAEPASRDDVAREEPRRTLEAAYEFARAKLLADEGSFEKAMSAYERTLELDGSDPYSRIEVAKFQSYLAQISRNAQKRLEYLKSAAGYAGEARRLAPENLEILSSYAQIHLRLGEHQASALDEAQEAYEELRRKTEGDLQVLTSLGQIYLWKQQGGRAAEVLEEASSYLPNHRMIHTMLLEAMMGSGRKREAEGVLEKLIAIEPGSLEYRVRLAELRSERGDHRAAAEGLSSAPEELLANPRLRQILAQELHLSGANEEALALTEALRSEIPSGVVMHRLRVAILSSLTRYQAAITELEAVLEMERDGERRLQDSLHLSRLLERVGRSLEAAEVLRAQLDQPDASMRLKVKLSLVGVLERQEQADEAVEILRRELEAATAPQLPVIGRTLSDLLARTDRVGEALDVIDETISRLESAERTEIVESLKLRRAGLLAIEEDWRHLAEEAPLLAEASVPEVRAAAVLLHAEALAGLGELDEALAILSSDESAVGSPRRLAKRAEILIEHDRETEATELLREVIDRGDVDDLLLAVQVYQRVERYADSIPLLERALGLQDDSLQALFLLGAAHERSGQRVAAISAFRRLLEISPDHSPTLNYLGYMWAENGENLPQAVSLILRAVALEPDNGAYVDSLGWAYFQLGRYLEARGHLEWAARLIPDDATIFEHLGDLYVVLEDIERARASYRQALALGGEDVDELERKLKTLDEKDL